MAFVMAAVRPTPSDKASSRCPARTVRRGSWKATFAVVFDNISHEWMLRHIPTDKGVLSKWLKAGFVENRILFPTKAGTPQGGIVSPTLANLTLDGLQRVLNEKFSRKLVPRLKVNLIGYADDFIITGT